jgi:N-acetylglutamate synthase-like GNAT family acetyltransferase
MMKVILCKTTKVYTRRLFELYQKFAEKHVGCMKRDEGYYNELCSMKGDFQWAIVENRRKLVGYAHGSYDETLKLGVITEIVVDPNHDFIEIARLLAERLQLVYEQRGAAWIYAFSIREPRYTQVFRDRGFSASKGTGKFMFAVTDPSKFLQDIAPIMASRLKHVDNFDGMIQIRCEEHCLSLRKEQGQVERIFLTSFDPDWKIILEKDILIGLLLGVVSIMNSYHRGQVIVETTLNRDKTEKLLESMFPQNQFLTLDQW